jgi:hypothetical protein
MGQSRRFDVRPATSGLPRATDIVSAGRQVGLLPKAEKTVQLLPNKFATGTVNFRSKVEETPQRKRSHRANHQDVSDGIGFALRTF